MATDPAAQAAHVEAHHAAARVLRIWPEKTGIDVMKAGIAAELAVEAAWPIIADLIRAQAFTEAADAVQRQRDDRRIRWSSTADRSADYGLGVALHTIFALRRGLGEGTENA